MSFAHEVICVSSSVRDQAVEYGLCPSGKIRVLCGGSGNGVDSTKRFNPENVPVSSRVAIRAKYAIPIDAIVLGFVGRIVWSKGIVELADAWRSLREEFPDVHLLMVGGAESEDPIPKQVAEQLHKDLRVHLVGEEWNTPPLYAAMDLVALPTYREGFPNVLLEAAAMRLAVVATSVPGCIDAVSDGVTGTLVPPYDSQKLAGAITEYLKDVELRHRHGSAARARVVVEFRQEAIWQALFQVYMSCLVRAKVGAISSRLMAGTAHGPHSSHLCE